VDGAFDWWSSTDTVGALVDAELVLQMFVRILNSFIQIT
jgi:hypothetical protein